MLEHFTKAYDNAMLVKRCNNLIFDTELLATKVCSRMTELINSNGYATIDELYTLAGLPSCYEDSKYGWTTFDGFGIRECLAGFEVIVPMAEELKHEFPIPIDTMSSDMFNQLLEELDGNSLKTLMEKNARYSANGDALHNFRKGADIAGGTPAQACWGYLTKHLVALRDMVEKDDFSNREDFLEKCQDSINYIRFLWCIGNDKITKKEND